MTTSVGIHAVAVRTRGSGGGTKLALHSGSSDGTTGVSPMHSAAPHPCAWSARVAPGAASATTAAENARSTMALTALPSPQTSPGCYDFGQLQSTPAIRGNPDEAGRRILHRARGLRMA